MCAIKRGMGVVVSKGRREGGLGQQSGSGQSKFTFAVKRQRRCVFNIFQRVLPFHVVSSSLSARRGSPEAQGKRCRGCRGGSTASSGQSCSLHGGTNFCTLNYKLKNLKALKAFAETKAKSKHNKGIKIASEQTNKRKQNCQQRGGWRERVWGQRVCVSVLLICTWNTKDTFS